MPERPRRATDLVRAAVGGKRAAAPVAEGEDEPAMELPPLPPRPTPQDAREELLRRCSARPPGGRTVAPAPVPPLDRLSISATYFTLRAGMVALAAALPLLLVALGLADGEVQPSLSAYYHAARAGCDYGAGGLRRDVFVGTLWAVGVFLLLYRGYSPAEDRALNVAGLAAVAVALFPTDWPRDVTAQCPAAAQAWVGGVHVVAAVTFFAAIAYVCLWCAKETVELLPGEPLQRRYYARYRVVGAAMVGLPALVLLLHWLLARGEGRLVLMLEAAAVWVFAAFWGIKSAEIRRIERG